MAHRTKRQQVSLEDQRRELYLEIAEKFKALAELEGGASTQSQPDDPGQPPPPEKGGNG